MTNQSQALPAIEASRMLSLPDVAYAEIREAIISYHLEPGSELRQERIASQLGISRLPVRDALRRLEAEGLVILRPRRGFVVAEINREEIVDLFELRGVLEGKAGYLATINRTEENVRRSEELLLSMETEFVGSNLDVNRFSKLNAAFHDSLFSPARRPHLERALRVTMGACERYARMSMMLSKSLEASSVEHRHILDAYSAGNPENVARLCEEHCVSTGRRLLMNLEEKGLLGKL